MPMTYAQWKKSKSRRGYKKKNYKRKGKGTKRIYQIAKKVAKNVMIKQEDPLFVQKQYGAYAPATGQWSAVTNIKPGPILGVYDEFVEIKQINNVAQSGLPGYRKDNEILVTGVRVQLRFILPQSIPTAWINIYLSFNRDESLLTTDYPTPDQVTMLRKDSNTQSSQNQLTMLKVISMKMSNDQIGFAKEKLIKFYHKFKNPIKLRYTGPNAIDLLNRRLALAIKTSYQLPNPAAYLNMVGSVITYYRDL